MRDRKWLAGYVKTGQELQKFTAVDGVFHIRLFRNESAEDEASLWEQLASASEADAVEPLDWSY